MTSTSTLLSQLKALTKVAPPVILHLEKGYTKTSTTTHYYTQSCFFNLMILGGGLMLFLNRKMRG